MTTLLAEMVSKLEVEVINMNISLWNEKSCYYFRLWLVKSLESFIIYKLFNLRSRKCLIILGIMKDLRI